MVYKGKIHNETVGIIRNRNKSVRKLTSNLETVGPVTTWTIPTARIPDKRRLALDHNGAGLRSPICSRGISGVFMYTLCTMFRSFDFFFVYARYMTHVVRLVFDIHTTTPNMTYAVYLYLLSAKSDARESIHFST